MSASITLDLHDAIVARLETDITIWKVYDAVPDGVQYPYGTFGSPDAAPVRVLDERAQRDNVVIDWWSLATVEVGGNVQYDGFLPLMEMAAKVRDLLMGARLTLPDHRVVGLRWQDDRYLRDPNPNLRHLQQVFSANTFQGA